METQLTNMTDHDLLIRLDTRMGGLETEMRLMRDNTVSDIKELKSDKLDRNEFSDYKIQNELTRREKIRDFEREFELANIEMKRIEKKTDFTLKVIYIGLGIVGTLQIVAPILMRYYFRQ